MKNQASPPRIGKEKVVPIVTLYLVSIAIILIGTAFSVYSLLNDITLPVMSSRVSGAVFGAVMVFLGIRYLISVGRLKAEVYKRTSSFSWSNFKKVGKAKS
ncbi:MAG: hypothetical protein VB064_09760 [Oscillospiraceae bacterium]|nr:hypothetical protein [Oscillospiraceae bacterium]